MDTVYRGVHRIYFWQILMMFDNLFRNNLYRAGSIETGTWKVSLPDLSTWRSFNDGNRHAQVYFEASLGLARISLKHSELRSSMDLRSGEEGMLDESAQAEVMNLVLEIGTVLSEWNIVCINTLIHRYFDCAVLIIDAFIGTITYTIILHDSCKPICKAHLRCNVNDNLIPPHSTSKHYLAPRAWP